MKTKQYKTYPVILIGCFTQEKIMTANRQVKSITAPEGNILHVYPDRMELKESTNFNLKTVRTLPISRHIEEILKGVREVKDGEWVYIAKVVK